MGTPPDPTSTAARMRASIVDSAPLHGKDQHTFKLLGVTQRRKQADRDIQVRAQGNQLRREDALRLSWRNLD